METTSLFYLRINPARFHYLKFILEGYDNMALLSSDDPKRGIVTLRCPEGMVGDLFKLLEAESSKLTRVSL